MYLEPSGPKTALAVRYAAYPNDDKLAGGMISIAAVVPLLGMMADPESAIEQPYVAWIAATLG